MGKDARRDDAGKGGSQREDTTDLEKGKTEGSFGSSSPLRKGTTWNMSVLTTDSFKEAPELSKTDPVSTYDPVSLKEPPELHSWKWIGLPERWLRYMMHKIVLEVDGRDQVCGLIFWQLLLLGFLCYSILLFKGEVDQRKLPPQSVSYVTKGPLMKHLERLPIMALCPVVVPSRRPQAPALHWSWDMQVLTEGFTDEDLQSDGLTSLLNVNKYSILQDRKADCLAVNQSCIVLDGKAYSEAASKNYHKMPVDQRVVLFRFFLFLFPPAPTDPPASPTEQAWLSMTMWLLTAWHPEEVCTEKGYSADRATHVPLQEMVSNRSMPITDGVRVRLKRLNRLGPLRLFGSGDTVEEFSYEVINGGATLYSANYVNALASRLPNGTRIFERSIRVSMSPVIINREEIETVNVWATLGVIAGAWGGFMLMFKLAFPSRPSGYRRLVKPLRKLSHRMMPKQVTTHLERFEQSLHRSEAPLSRQSSAGTMGEESSAPAEPTRLGEARADPSSSSLGTMVRAWRRRLRLGGAGAGPGSEGTRSRSNSSSSLGSRSTWLTWGGNMQRTASVRMPRLVPQASVMVSSTAAHFELPALDTRVFELEQVVKAIVDREAQARRRLRRSRTKMLQGDSMSGSGSSLQDPKQNQ